MKKITALYTMSMLLLLSLTPAMAKNKRFTLPQTTITAQLQPDGSMTVTESRTYDFDGHFRYAYRELPRRNNVSFSGLCISEAGQPYTPLNDKSPGTYQINEDDAGLEIRWHFNARNEARTFDFTYTVKGTVQRFEDGADFQFEFIAPGWATSHQNVKIILIPPPAESQAATEAWVHGPLWDDPKVAATGEITLAGDRLYRKLGITVRALYPSESFPQMVLERTTRREAILAEESKRQAQRLARQEEIHRKAKAMAQRQQWGRWLLMGLALIGLWGWWQFFQRYGKRPQVNPMEPMRYSPPHKTPPAMVNYLLSSRQVTAQAMVSTLFDLSRRGFLTLEETDAAATATQRKRKPSAQWRINRQTVTEQKTELAEYEQKLIDFLFTELTQGEDVLPLKLLKKKQSAMMSFFNKWTQEVKKAGKTYHWFDLSSDRGMYRSMGLAGFVMLLTIPAGFLFGPYALILLGGGLLQLLLSLAIAHRTPEGEMAHSQWKAYKKFLVKAQKDATLRAQGLSYIVEHLIYGPALDLQPHQMEKITAWMEADRAAALMPWFKLPEGMTLNTAFVPILAAVMASTTTSVSTATGASAGASAGAGGAG